MPFFYPIPPPPQQNRPHVLSSASPGFLDTTGRVWYLVVNSIGILSFAPAAPSPPQLLVLSASINWLRIASIDGAFWYVSPSDTGNILVAPVAPTGSGETVEQVLYDELAILWYLRVTTPGELQTAQQVSNRQQLRAVDVIAAHYFIPPPLPTLKGRLSPGIPGQSVDTPVARAPRIDTQLRAWVAPDPLPQQKDLLSPTIPGQSIDVPPIPVRWQPKGWPDPAWVVPAHAPFFVPVTLGPVANDPPFSQRKLDARSVLLWHLPLPPLPQQARHLPIVITAVPEDTVLVDPRLRLAESVMAWWTVAPPPPTTKAHLAPGIPGQSTDRPPRDIRNIVASAIMPWWAPLSPVAQLARLSLPIVIMGTIDDPPFSQRGVGALMLVELAWEASLAPPHRFGLYLESVPEEGPPPDSAPQRRLFLGSVRNTGA